MVECKVVINDPKTGKSYQKVIDDKKLKTLVGLRIGDEFDAGLIDLPGYRLKITGGSDRDGFPMRPGVHTTARIKILASGGVGYNPPEKGVKRRKSVRGEIIDMDIAQINAIVVKEGKQKLEEIFGKGGGEEGTGQ